MNFHSGGSRKASVCLKASPRARFRVGTVGRARSGVRGGGSRNGLCHELAEGVEERLLRRLIEPGEAHLDRLGLVTEHGKSLADVDETTSGNDLVNATLAESCTTRLCPLRQSIGKDVIDRTELVHRLGDDLLLGRARSILLLKGVIKTVEERLVHHASTDESTIIGTLALGVGSRNDREANSRSDPAIDLLEIHALALKDRLKAHDLLGAEVDLIKKKHTAVEHGVDNRTILPHGVAVDETETAEEIVLVSHLGDVDAVALTVELRTNLLDHRGLAVARHARDEDRREELRLDDLLDVAVVTPCDIGGRNGRNESCAITTRHAENRSSDTLGAGQRDRAGRNNRRCDDSCHRRGCSNRSSNSLALNLGDMELATTSVTRSILHNPSRRELLPDAVGRREQLLTRHGRNSGDGSESVDERSLLVRHGRHTIETPNTCERLRHTTRRGGTPARCTLYQIPSFVQALRQTNLKSLSHKDL